MRNQLQAEKAAKGVFEKSSIAKMSLKTIRRLSKLSHRLSNMSQIGYCIFRHCLPPLLQAFSNRNTNKPATPNAIFAPVISPSNLQE